IAAEGPSAFYEGEAATALVTAVRDAGGVLTEADLASYEPRPTEPLTGSFDGLTLHVMPPPSSGGVALLETLNVLTAREERAGRLSLDSPAGRHRLTEALKHSFADRAAFLGDPYHAARTGDPLPIRRLISREYAEALAAKIDPARTFPPAHYGRIAPVRDGGTSHLSVVDAAGNAVACTETINTVFGSLVVTETGVILNNEMDDFAARPGKPNAYGLLQSEANAVGPGRVPLSSMSPTIGVRGGRATLAVCASGGPRIITATLQTLLNRVRGGMSPSAAVAAPRLHHQWIPDRLEAEPAIYDETRRALGPLGHEVRERADLGVAQIAVRNADGTLSAAADPRKGGAAAGF
ncbi:MAG: gamma-glutamyltransferase, partial [Planctomycetota bacterium]